MPSPPFAYEPRGKRARHGKSFRLRFWSVRHARLLEHVYDAIERLLLAAAPLIDRLGYARIEGPMAFAERHIKARSSIAGCAETASSPQPGCPAR